MSTPHPDDERIAKALIEGVQYYAGAGQYPEGSDEQKAYIDGVKTATACMYIDLTGGAKSKGLLSTLRADHAREVFDRVLTELHAYNNQSDCEPEWHDGFSTAIDKVEELALK